MPSTVRKIGRLAFRPSGNLFSTSCAERRSLKLPYSTVRNGLQFARVRYTKISFISMKLDKSLRRRFSCVASSVPSNWMLYGFWPSVASHVRVAASRDSSTSGSPDVVISAVPARWISGTPPPPGAACVRGDASTTGGGASDGTAAGDFEEE